MTDLSPVERVLDALRRHGGNPTQHGDSWQDRCPAHEDRIASLSISVGQDGRGLLKCHAGCANDAVLLALGLEWTDLFPEATATSSKREILSTYDYTDEAGVLLYQAVRYSPKGFAQRRPDSHGGWEWNLKGVKRVPYRLPGLVAGIADRRWIVVCEGEKDVDALLNLGFVATTNAAGAGKWPADWAPIFTGAKVAVLPDNDGPGRQHAQAVANSLQATAAVVKVVELPGLPDKGDVTDWIVAGGTADQLKQQILNASEGVPVDQEISTPKAPGPRLLSSRADTITPSRPEWLWRPWLAQGLLQLMIGRQGCGKTTFAAWVVGQLSAGSQLPGEGPDSAVTKCAILSLEESAARIVARLHAVGADVANIHVFHEVEEPDSQGGVVTRPWRLPRDCAVLEAKLVEEGIGLCVIDGLGYAVNGDSKDYGTVGAALSSLAKTAERTGATILGLTHPPKGASDPVTAAIGSTAWTAVARICWVMGLHPEDESQEDMPEATKRRVVRVSKSAYSQPDEGLAFRITEDERWECGFVVGLETSAVTAGALTSAPGTPEERGERSQAREILKEMLRDNSVDQKTVAKAIDEAGISPSTLKRARSDLHVKSEARRDDEGKVVGWSLSLPDAQGGNQGTTTPPGPLDPLASTRENVVSSGPVGQDQGTDPLATHQPLSDPVLAEF